jgi:hypothetical protein
MNWKNGRPKGTVKAVWQKTGMAIKKKKKKTEHCGQAPSAPLCIREVPDSNPGAT